MSTSDSSKDLEVLEPTGKTIKVAGTEFVIRPFVLRNRIKFVKIVSEVFASMSLNMSKDVQDSPLKSIPLLIESAGEKLTDVYVLVLEKDREWCETKIYIKDEIEILNAIYEVNDIPFIVRRIQEILPKALKSK